MKLFKRDILEKLDSRKTMWLMRDMVIDEEGIDENGFPYYELVSPDKKYEVCLGVYIPLLWPYKLELEEGIDDYRGEDSEHSDETFFEAYKIAEDDYFVGHFGVFEELYPEDSIYPQNQVLSENEKYQHMLRVISFSIGSDKEHNVTIEEYKDEYFEGYVGRHNEEPVVVYAEDIIETYFDLIDAIEEHYATKEKETPTNSIIIGSPGRGI